MSLSLNCFLLGINLLLLKLTILQILSTVFYTSNRTLRLMSNYLRLFVFFRLV